METSHLDNRKGRFGGVLAEPKVQDFINAHTGALDSTFKQVEIIFHI